MFENGGTKQQEMGKQQAAATAAALILPSIYSKNPNTLQKSLLYLGVPNIFDTFQYVGTSTAYYPSKVNGGVIHLP